MMVDVLSAAQVQEARFRPAACIRRSVNWFKDLRVPFTHELDDLDSYEFAALRTGSGLSFGLMHYDQRAATETTLLLPQDALAGTRLSDAISAVAAEFRIPLQDFVWEVPIAA